ncbi:DUF6538 domain-containing protein [Halodesulfovibrio marinisediminis]|uniref:DUF6538 domain-containing protein n=1 Tax=Halodesulfovibrio marinisediminis DSM 17456 TaxID=1121457 RepID=A0A1N6DP29_9BACT|nr:DUF6538 domain-containing protein [Halodesulfovibrio marinisediminis]SIN72434.1 hypothetical protein SAMN02745161_0352 [Halodesulfovibrio marinisediminis DSM 17456]
MANYLFQTASAHCFRRIIPLDLRPVLGIRKLRYSLGTLKKREAQRTSKKLASATPFLFDRIRTTEMSKLTPEQLNYVVHKYIKNWIKTDTEEAPKSSIDVRNDMLKHYALTKGKLVTTTEGVEIRNASPSGRASRPNATCST